MTTLRYRERLTLQEAYARIKASPELRGLKRAGSAREGKQVAARNLEVVRQALLTIAGSRKIVFGAVDTDGTDGPGGFRYPGAPECLAGAITDGETAQAAKQAGIDLEDALRTHGTSEPLWRLGCGVAAAANVSALPPLRMPLSCGSSCFMADSLFTSPSGTSLLT